MWRRRPGCFDPPLHVEFPGFTRAVVVLGHMTPSSTSPAAQDADVRVTLDVGHLLSYSG